MAEECFSWHWIEVAYIAKIRIIGEMLPAGRQAGAETLIAFQNLAEEGIRQTWQHAADVIKNEKVIEIMAQE